MTTSRARLVAAISVVLLAAALSGGLTGCGAADPLTPSGETGRGANTGTSTGTSEACVDWVHFRTPDEAAADAGVVLRGSVVERDGTAPMFGAEANRWLFDVEKVLARPEPSGGVEPPPEVEVSPGDRIAVVSTPETCSAGGPYPDGDPLDPATGPGGPGGSVIVLLSDGDGQGGEGDLHLITPFQGVLVPGAGGSLPGEWPAP
jgi:hypothetical protein